jgi:hypothetical protein
LILKNNIWVGTTTTVYTVLFFVFSGGLNLMKTNFTGVTKNSAIKDFFTIGNFQILFLVLATCVMAGIFFRNKEDQLRMRLKDKKDRILYFKESLMLLVTPIVIGIFINFLLKSVLYAMDGEKLATLQVPFYVIFNSCIYMFVVAVLGVAVSFLFQITMKPRLTAALYPLFIFESLILLFGVSNLFASSKIPGVVGVSNFTASVVLNYLNMFTSKLRVETLGTEVFFITILAVVTGAIVCFAGISRFLVTYKEKTLTHNYRSTFLRRFIILDLVALFVVYLSIAGFGAYSMLKMNSITLEQAFEYTAMVSIILIPTLTVLFENLYMKRYNLIELKVQKKERKPKKVKANNTLEVTKNIENNGQNVDVKINIDVKINETSLESKGIVKETIKTSYIPKNGEHLSGTKDLGKREVPEVEGVFEKNISDDDSSKGFEELFFDEDIKIKESSEVQKEYEDSAKEEKVSFDDVKMHQREELDNSFFTTVEHDNK